MSNVRRDKVSVCVCDSSPASVNDRTIRGWLNRRYIHTVTKLHSHPDPLCSSSSSTPLPYLFSPASPQKPKQKDWHPPDGFILGLWTLILLVFFKTYGVKHLKHIF
ncbi:hypothetical protein ILYODFUR_026291 [Ilyodon furcidens]|uniref:Uncharacterized protein n=1 Tax=Ilyodon furcidens TaxID=33524 RepID=A0ABV0UAB2_9TELE